MESRNNKVVSLSSVRRERRPVPCDPVIATLLDRAATMQQVALPLQQGLADLQKDLRPRRRAFWQTQLRALAALQEAMQPCIDLLCEDLTPIPFVLRIVRYDILCSLFPARTEMEKIAIAIAAYLPQCQSLSEKSLRSRKKIVDGMRSLVSYVEQAV